MVFHLPSLLKASNSVWQEKMHHNFLVVWCVQHFPWENHSTLYFNPSCENVFTISLLHTLVCPASSLHEKSFHTKTGWRGFALISIVFATKIMFKWTTLNLLSPPSVENWEIRCYASAARTAADSAVGKKDTSSPAKYSVILSCSWNCSGLFFSMLTHHSNKLQMKCFVTSLYWKFKNNATCVR